jgi:hypothetical protein
MLLNHTELAWIAKDGEKGPLRILAQELAESRDGPAWEQMLAGREQTELSAFVTEMSKQPIGELLKLLSHHLAELVVLRRVIARKLEENVDAMKRQSPVKSRAGVVQTVRTSRRSRGIVEPKYGNDYLKPESKEFGMPEYDLE